MTHRSKSISSEELWNLNFITTPLGREFIPVTECCTSECWKTVDEEAQAELFDLFEQSTTKEIQDVYLSTCMQQKNANRTYVENSRRANTWSYHIHYKDLVRVKVCQKFIRKLYQVTEKRIRIIQKKILYGKSFAERRGSHNKRANKYPPQIYTLLEEHLKQFPNEDSDDEELPVVKYLRTHSLNVKNLYELFREYYKEKTNQELAMKYNTYLQYYYKLTKMFMLQSLEVSAEE